MRNIAVTLFAVILTTSVMAQQNSVGINVPDGQLNSNAVLELVSPGQDQGFLVPRLSTGERTTMASALTDVDNGLIVYDRDLNQFFYWRTGSWKPGLGVFSETTAGGDLTGTFPAPDIAAGAVDSDKILDGSITTDDLANGAVENSDIGDNAVTGTKIQDGSVTGDDLENISGLSTGTFGNEFTTVELVIDENGRVTGITTQAILITSSNIDDLSILNEDIQNGTITISKIDAESNTDKVLAIDGSGLVYWEDRSVFTSSALVQDQILIGNGSDIAEGQPVTGDVTITNTGTAADIQLNAASVQTADIADDAIDKDKINADIADDGLGQNTDGSLKVLTGNGISINNDTLEADLTGIAGNGLVENGGQLEVDINGMANSVTTVDDSDLLFIYDSDGTLVGKITRQALIESAAITNINLDGGDIANAVTINKSPTVDFNSGDVQGSLTLTQLNDGTGALTIQNDAVTTDKIGDSEVRTADIADLQVTTGKLGNDAVTTGKIADGEVRTLDIADLNVTNAKLASNAVTTDKIFVDAVTADKINPDVAGEGLIPNGTDGSLEVNAGNGLQLSTDVLSVDLADLAGDGLVDNGTTEQFDVNVDDVTLEVLGDVVQIKDQGVDNDKIADQSVTFDKIDGGVFSNSFLVTNAGTIANWFTPGVNQVIVTGSGGAITTKPLTDFETNTLSQGTIWAGNASNVKQEVNVGFANQMIVGTGSGQTQIASVPVVGDINVAYDAGDVELDMFIQPNAVQGVDIDATTGSFDVVGVQNISFTTSSATAGAFQVNASAGDVDVDGQNVSIDANAGNLSLDASANSNLTAGGTMDIDGAGGVVIDATGGSIGIGTDANANPINIGTGLSNRAITIGNANGTTGLNIDAASGGVDVDATGGNISLTTNTSGLVDIDGATGIALDAAANDIDINSAAGQVDIDGGTTVAIDGNSGVTITATNNDVDITGDNNVDITATSGEVTFTAPNTQVVSGTFELANGGIQVNEIVDDATVNLGTPSDSKLVTETALATAIGDQAGSGLTYDGVNNEIDLGGNLTGDAIIGTNGNAFSIESDDTGAGTNYLSVADGTGNIVVGDGTVTTGSGQVTLGGNVDANAGVDISGGALTINNQAITQTGAGQVTLAGNLDAQNGVDITNADLTVGGANFTVDDASGNTSVLGTLDVDGATTLDQTTISTADGAFAVSGANGTSISTTSDAAGAISLSTNGGTLETIAISNAQGTATNAVDIDATAGGVEVDAGGAVSIDAASSSNVTVGSTAAGNTALTLSSTNAGAGQGNVAITADDNITLTAPNVAISGAFAPTSLDVDGLTQLDQTQINTTDGELAVTGTNGVNIDVATDIAGQVDLAASAVATNVRGTLNVAEAADFNGTANFDGATTVSGTGSLDVDGATTLDQTTISTADGAFAVSGANGTSISTTSDAAGAISLSTNGGTLETIAISNAQGTATNAVDIDATAGGVEVDAGGAVSIDAASSSNVTVGSTAAGNTALTLSSTNAGAGQGNVAITADDNITLTAPNVAISGAFAPTSLDVDGLTQLDQTQINTTDGELAVTGTNGVNIDVATDIAGQVDLAASAVATNVRGTLNVAEAADFNGTANFDGATTVSGTGSLDVDGATTLDQTTISTADGAFAVSGANGTSISTTSDAAGAISLSTNGGTLETIAISNAQGTATNAVDIDATAGGVEVDAGGAVSIDAASSSNVTVGSTAAGNTALTLSSTNAGAGQGNVAITADDNITLTAPNVAISGAFAPTSLDVDGLTQLDQTQINTTDGELAVTGTNGVNIDVATDIAGQVDLAASAVATNVRGTLDVAEQTDLAATGVATNVRGTLNVAEAADFNGTANFDGATTVSGTGSLDVDGATTLDQTTISTADGAFAVSGANGTSISTTSDAAGAISLSTNGGTLETIAISNAQGTATNAVDIDATAGGVEVDAGGAVSIDAASSSNVTVGSTAAGNTALTLSSTNAGAGQGNVAITADDNITLTAPNVAISGAFAPTSLDVDGLTQLDQTQINTTDGELAVTGTNGVNIDVATDIAGQVDLAASAVATNVRGTLNVAEAADFNGTANFDGATTVSGTGSLDVDGATTLDQTTISTADGAFAVSGANGTSISTTSDAAGAISLSTNGGTLETIAISNAQGTATNAVDIDATAGGVEVDAGGAVSIDAASSSNVTVGSTAAGNTALTLSSTNAGAGQGNVAITADDNITLTAPNVAISGAFAPTSLDVDGLTQLDQTQINTTDGELAVTGTNGVNIDVATDIAGQVDLAASAVATNVRGTLNVAEAADFNGTANFDGATTVSGTGSLDVDGATTLDQTTISTADGAFAVSGANGTSISTTSDAAGAISLSTNGGTLETIAISNAQGTATNAVDIDATAGGVEVDAGGAVSIDAASSSNVTVGSTAAGNTALTLSSTNAGAGQGNVAITADDNITLTAPNVAISGAFAPTSLDVDGLTQLDQTQINTTDGELAVTGTNGVNIDVATDIAGQVDLAASAVATNVRGTLNVAEAADFNGTANFDGATTVSGTGSLDVDGATTLDQTTISTADGAFAVSGANGTSISTTSDAAGAISLSTNGGTLETIAISNAQGTATNAVDIDATAGGVEVDAGGAVSIDAASSSNVTVGSTAAGNTALTLSSTNAGAGQGNVAITADDNITLTAPNVTISGTVQGLTTNADVVFDELTNNATLAAADQTVDATTFSLPNFSGATATLATTDDITNNDEVAMTAANAVPRWDGTDLVDGTLSDNGTVVTLGGGETLDVSAGTLTLAANQVADASVVDALTISGGSIDNTAIGATTRSTANVTALDANGNVTLGSDNLDDITINGEIINDPVFDSGTGTTTVDFGSTGTRTLTIPDATTTMVGTDVTQTLTNKSIDADNNTITNIENADIKAAANIARSKLASGTLNHVVINDGTGVLSSEAQLAVSRGGTGVSSLSNVTSTGSTLTVTGGTGAVIGGNVNVDLPNVGPGAGTIGGGAQYVNTITLDNQGRVTGATAGTPSDIRLKENVERIQGAFEKVQQVNGYTYDWIDKSTDPNQQLGVIAQELEQIFPNLVYTNENGYKSVNYIGLIPVLIEAIKEQQKVINQLMTDVESEKSDKQSLKAALDKQMKLSEMHMELMMSLQNENSEMKDDLEDIKALLGVKASIKGE